MEDQAQKVVARYLEADAQLQVRDEGAFVLEYLPQHGAAVESIVAKIHKAIDMYKAAGIPIKHKVLVQLSGKRAAHADALYWMDSNPPLMAIAPKAYKDPLLLKTIIHEFGHYVHDKVVPGSHRNTEINRRYRWAMKQRATGEGPKLDIIRTKRKKLDLEIAELRENRYVTKPLPKKGEVFDYTWRNMSGKAYTLTVRIVQKSGKKVILEVLNPPEDRLLDLYRRGFGNPMITDTTDAIQYVGVKPEVEAKIKLLEAENHVLFEEADAIARTEKDDRYEAQRHEWVPTKYSRTNNLEWFAELCTTLVLGHLKKPVDGWLLSVVQTGEAPPEITLP